MYNKRQLAKDEKSGKHPRKPKKLKKNGVITDPMGQWAHPGEVTRIPSGDITMQGVPYPVLGVDDQGNEQMMYPDQDYQFPGSSVTEYPQMQDGGWLDNYQDGGTKGRCIPCEEAREEYLRAKKEGVNIIKKKKLPSEFSLWFKHTFGSNKSESHINPRMMGSPGSAATGMEDGGWLDQYQDTGEVKLPEDYEQFEEYNQTAPENRVPDRDWQYGNPKQYDHYGMWDALGKPKNFTQALKNNPDWTPDKYDNMYHGFSANPNTGVWLKPFTPGEHEPGSTAWMEYAATQLRPELYNNYSVVYDTDLKRMKGIPKKQRDGGAAIIDRLGRIHSPNSGYVPWAQNGMQYNFPADLKSTAADSSAYRTYVMRYLQGRPSVLDRAHELEVSVIPDWLDFNTKNQVLMERNAYKEGERLKKLMDSKKQMGGGIPSHNWLDKYQDKGEYKWDPNTMNVAPQAPLPTAGTYNTTVTPPQEYERATAQYEAEQEAKRLKKEEEKDRLIRQQIRHDYNPIYGKYKGTPSSQLYDEENLVNKKYDALARKEYIDNLTKLAAVGTVGTAAVMAAPILAPAFTSGLSTAAAVGSAGYGAYSLPETYRTVTNPNIGNWDKVSAVGWNALDFLGSGQVAKRIAPGAKAAFNRFVPPVIGAVNPMQGLKGVRSVAPGLTESAYTAINQAHSPIIYGAAKEAEDAADFARMKAKFDKYKKEGLSAEQKQMMKDVDDMLAAEKRAAGNAMGTIDDANVGFPNNPYLSLQNPKTDPFDLSWDPDIKRTGWTNISNLGYDPVPWWKNLLQYGSRPLERTLPVITKNTSNILGSSRRDVIPYEDFSPLGARQVYIQPGQGVSENMRKLLYEGMKKDMPIPYRGEYNRLHPNKYGGANNWLDKYQDGKQFSPLVYRNAPRSVPPPVVPVPPVVSPTIPQEYQWANATPSPTGSLQGTPRALPSKPLVVLPQSQPSGYEYAWEKGSTTSSPTRQDVVEDEENGIIEEAVTTIKDEGVGAFVTQLANYAGNKYSEHTGSKEDVNVKPLDTPKTLPAKEEVIVPEEVKKPIIPTIEILGDTVGTGNRVYVPVAIDTKQARFNYRNRGDTKDIIGTKGAYLSTYAPFRKTDAFLNVKEKGIGGINDDNSTVITLDTKTGQIGGGLFKDVKNNKDIVVSKTLPAKMISSIEIDQNSPVLKSIAQKGITLITADGRKQILPIGLGTKGDGKQLTGWSGGKMFITKPDGTDGYFVYGTVEQMKKQLEKYKATHNISSVLWYDLDHKAFSQAYQTKNQKITGAEAISMDNTNSSGGNFLYLEQESPLKETPLEEEEVPGRGVGSPMPVQTKKAKPTYKVGANTVHNKQVKTKPKKQYSEDFFEWYNKHVPQEVKDKPEVQKLVEAHRLTVQKKYGGSNWLNQYNP